MSLWTDGEIIAATDLAAIDSSVPKVAASESIGLEGDGSVIRQAWNEIGDYLLEVMQQFTGDAYMWPSTPAYTGLYAVNRSRFLLNQIVTTAQYGMKASALVTFTTHYAMTLFWKQATRRTEKDRYLAKLKEAQEDLKQARRRFWAAGIPIVMLPLSAPGALFDPLSNGPWGPGNVSVTGTSANTDPALYDVAATYVDQTSYQSQTQRGNAESGPSQFVTVTLDEGLSLTASLAGLTPPGTLPYQSGIADGVHYSRNATGWNVYIGPTGSPFVLQNSTPLALNADFPAVTVGTILATGPLMGPGQVPDINQRPTRTFSRG